MEINELSQGVSVSVVLSRDETKKLRKEYETGISWMKTPKISDLVSEILDYADEDD